MVGALVTSCDMDKKPYGSLDNDTAIQNLNDCRRFRNGLYSSMRSLTTGGYVNYPEIQMDMFHGVSNNGNRIGEFSNGNINSATRDIATIWGIYIQLSTQLTLSLIRWMRCWQIMNILQKNVQN